MRPPQSRPTLVHCLGERILQQLRSRLTEPGYQVSGVELELAYYKVVLTPPEQHNYHYAFELSLQQRPVRLLVRLLRSNCTCTEAVYVGVGTVAYTVIDPADPEAVQQLDRWVDDWIALMTSRRAG